MNIELLKDQKEGIAVASGYEIEIQDVQSALDLAMTVKYEMGAAKIAIDKKIICEDFFILSTGIAGEILQKYINYHIKAAIYGDFFRYTSKPLKDFIYESNHGSDFFFVSTKEEAIQKIGAGVEVVYMKKWYAEEYEFEIEVTGFLRGDHTERYCRNGEEIGDRYTCTYGCPVNENGQGICSKVMMLLFPIMEAVRSGGDLENLGGSGKYCKDIVCPDGCVLFRLTAKNLGNENFHKGKFFE